MSEQAHGFILRTRPLTETSLIVQWLTAEQGRIATVAKGARRPKSPFRGKLDLFHEAEFSFVRSKRSDLHNLREVKLADTHSALRKDIVRLNQAAYAGMLIEQTTEKETPLEEVYEIYGPFIRMISQIESSPVSVLLFETHLLDRLGFRPDLSEVRLSAAGKALVGNWLCSDAFQPVEDLPPGIVREVSRFLKNYMLCHLERVPRIRDEVLAGII